MHDRMIWDVTLSGEDGASEAFETTDDHPWWIVGADGSGQWRVTEDLTVGMTVVSRRDDGPDQFMTVTQVTATNREDTTYNFTVADFHTYFVGENRVLVHNCTVGDPPIDIGNTPNSARRALDDAGYPGQVVTRPGGERATMHSNVPGRDGPMDVRVMDGGPNHGPRAVTSLPGQPRAHVRADGSRYRNNESNRERREGGHTPLVENKPKSDS